MTPARPPTTALPREAAAPMRHTPRSGRRGATTGLAAVLLRLLALALLLAATPARADRFDEHLQTVWEVLWDQRGLPRPVLRWERGEPLVWRLSGDPAESHRGLVEMALREVAGAAGLPLRPWDAALDGPADAVPLDIRIVSDTDLTDTEPCLTRVRRAERGLLRQVQVLIRPRNAWRCAWHELVHAMGLPGHPSAHTVLSYFHRRRHELTDLDRLMLAAWYSPAMPPQATPLDALVVLTEAVARSFEPAWSPQEGRARIEAFQARAVQEMQALARGEGGVPAIVIRSGKASEAHRPQARRLSALYLAQAHARGTIVARDARAGRQWLDLAASLAAPATGIDAPAVPSAATETNP